MTQLVRGYDGVTEQPKRKRKSGSGGWTTLREFRGPKAAINALKYDPLLAGADEMEVTEGGSNARLTASYPFDDDAPGSDRGAELSVVWECQPQELDKDLRAHPAFANLEKEIAAVDRLIDEGKADQVLNADPGTWAAATLKYVNLRLIGTTNFKDDYYYVTKTTKCGRASDVKAAAVGARVVVSVADLKIPDTAKITLPAGWQALKGKPAVTQVPGGWMIVERWLVVEKWSGTLYTGGSGTP